MLPVATDEHGKKTTCLSLCQLLLDDEGSQLDLLPSLPCQLHVTVDVCNILLHLAQVRCNMTSRFIFCGPLFMEVVVVVNTSLQRFWKKIPHIIPQVFFCVCFFSQVDFLRRLHV